MLQPYTATFTEIDLGQHTLILKSDDSLELFATAGDGLDLDSDEAYRLYICLHARFQPPQPLEEEEE